MKVIIKILIASFLLISLFHMPYGYYQIMRISVTILFGWLAYIEWNENRKIMAFLCGIAVIVFQPIQKLAFHKKEWQAIDLWLAIALIVWVAYDLFRLRRIV